MSFEFNPLEVGNFAALGMMEENVQNAKMAMRDLMEMEDDGIEICKEDIDAALDAHGVDYWLLPKYARNWFNQFDI